MFTLFFLLLNFQRVKAIPGLVRLSNELWFLQSKQRYQFHSDFDKNNLALEDEAIISSKKKKYIEETDSSYHFIKKVAVLKKPPTSAPLPPHNNNSTP